MISPIRQDDENKNYFIKRYIFKRLRRKNKKIRINNKNIRSNKKISSNNKNIRRTYFLFLFFSEN